MGKDIASLVKQVIFSCPELVTTISLAPAGLLEADKRISSRKRLHVGIQDLPKGSGIKVALS
jgi:hypothetical protein